jgi:hypothetical protein
MLDGVCLTTAGAVARLAGPSGPASAFNAAWTGPLAAHRRAIGDLNTATHHAQLARAVMATAGLFEGRLLVALGGVQVRCGRGGCVRGGGCAVAEPWCGEVEGLWSRRGRGAAHG